MKWSESFLYTVKEVPNDAEIVSHQLLIRSGMLKKLGPGLYTYQTFALRALNKFSQIIRQELDRKNCQEVLMPMVCPKELWEETGRWDKMGAGLLKFTNRNEHDYCLGATHEEVVTDLVRNDLKSYKHFPRTIYQIQTKYRDEIRPRFGLMRCREFLMKDAYSFDLDQEAALKSYDRLYSAYQTIFDRLGLEYRIVEADAGNIGGSQSHEFQVLADAGEDHLLVCDSCEYAANIEVAPSTSEQEVFGEEALPKQEFATPGQRSIADLSKFTGQEERHLVKTMFFMADDDTSITVLLRGNDEVHPIKIKKSLNLNTEPRLLSDGEVLQLTGANPGSCGPVGLNNLIIADEAIKNYTNMIVGANKDDFHLKNVNFDRDFKVSNFYDLKQAKVGDPCPRCENGKYKSYRGIEVGHCFYLGQTYSKPMKAEYLDQNGKTQTIEMGCYGIGVSRSIQAAIEQSHDKDGIIWPQSIAPFQVHICNLDPDNTEVQAKSLELYEQLWDAGLETFMDDRKERPGVKFKDADLLGLPVRITIGARGLQNNEIEFTVRKTRETEKVSSASVFSHIQKFFN